MSKEIYKEQILESIPLILSAQDRDSSSPTYGCFDREYWAWATKDFSNIDLQRAVYPLAVLWSTPQNPYYKQEKILEWIIAGVEFWCKAQHKDGSFDHLYPNEHSIVGASFTLYEIAETFLIIKNSSGERLKTKLLHHMIKSADFLVKTTESHGFVSNHRAGTACALYLMFKITSNQKYKIKAQSLINSIKENQSKEGWFNEYDSFDPGYQTLATHYLANYYRLSKDELVLDMLKSSIKFLSYFIHPNGTLGGEYGSRNTEIYYPSGFEILSTKIPEAQSIASFLLASIQKKTITHLTEMDIRNLVPFLSSYTIAYTYYARTESPTLPFKKQFDKYFPEANIYIRSTKNYYAILGISKGGVLKVYNETELKYSNSGFIITLNKDSKISNQMLSSPKAEVKENKVSFKTSFFKIPSKTMTPAKFLCFRIFNLTFGRIQLLNNFVRKNLIIGKFVRPGKKTSLSISREFIFEENQIKINDVIENPKALKILNISTLSRFTTIFMASSKYYQPQDLLKQQSQITLTSPTTKRHITLNTKIKI